MEWKDVVGFEGRYRVSDCGQIYSLPKLSVVGRNGGLSSRGNKLLRQYTLKNGGHQRVYLSDGSGKKVPLLVHRIVAAAFVPNTNGRPVVHHIDGNPLNNSAANLEWCTVGQNTAAADRRRVKLRGENNGASTLTDSIVRTMRLRYAECGNASAVAREFGVSAKHAWNICHGKVWTHVHEEK